VRFGHRRAGEHLLDCGVQQVTGHRLTVAWRGFVERAPVGQPAPSVVQEEVGRAGGVVGTTDLLVVIDQVRKDPARAPGLLGQALGSVVRIGFDVVATDPHDGQARELREYLAQLGLDVTHVRAVIAQEHDQQRTCRGELVAPDGGTRQVREGEIGRWRAERDHQRRDSHASKRTNPPGPRAPRDRRAVRESTTARAIAPRVSRLSAPARPRRADTWFVPVAASGVAPRAAGSNDSHAPTGRERFRVVRESSSGTYRRPPWCIDCAGGTRGLHDFEADLPNGTVAAVEVTGDMNSDRLTPEAELEPRSQLVQLPPFGCPGSFGSHRLRAFKPGLVTLILVSERENDQFATTTRRAATELASSASNETATA